MRSISTPARLAVAVLLAVAACRRPPPVSWTVISHDPESGPWVVRTIDRRAGVTRELTLMCDSSEGNGYKVTGANACNLLLGRMMVPNTETDTGDYLSIVEAGKTVTISEGPPNSRFVQRFTVQRSRTVP